jgi:hypothetical protein
MKRKKSARWTPGLKKLKAISIRQPWAWLIVNGYKDIENRIWAAKLRGPVLMVEFVPLTTSLDQTRVGYIRFPILAVSHHANAHNGTH